MGSLNPANIFQANDESKSNDLDLDTKTQEYPDDLSENEITDDDVKDNDNTYMTHTTLQPAQSPRQISQQLQQNNNKNKRTTKSRRRGRKELRTKRERRVGNSSNTNDFVIDNISDADTLYSDEDDESRNTDSDLDYQTDDDWLVKDDHYDTLMEPDRVWKESSDSEIENNGDEYDEYEEDDDVEYDNAPNDTIDDDDDDDDDVDHERDEDDQYNDNNEQQYRKNDSYPHQTSYSMEVCQPKRRHTSQKPEEIASLASLFSLQSLMPHTQTAPPPPLTLYKPTTYPKNQSLHQLRTQLSRTASPPAVNNTHQRINSKQLTVGRQSGRKNIQHRQATPAFFFSESTPPTTSSSQAPAVAASSQEASQAVDFSVHRLSRSSSQTKQDNYHTNPNLTSSDMVSTGSNPVLISIPSLSLDPVTTPELPSEFVQANQNNNDIIHGTQHTAPAQASAPAQAQAPAQASAPAQAQAPAQAPAQASAQASAPVSAQASALNNIQNDEINLIDMTLQIPNEMDDNLNMNMSLEGTFSPPPRKKRRLNGSN